VEHSVVCGQGQAAETIEGEVMAGRCHSCAHFAPGELRDPEWGSCGRWKLGYGFLPTDCQPDEVIVENDEGWGAIMGPNFGCVLWEAK